MEGEKKAPVGGQSRAAQMARLGGYVLGAAAALFLVFWTAALFVSRRESAEQSGSAASKSAGVDRSAIGSVSEEGYIRVRLRVSAVDENGTFLPMGSEIGESVGLTLAGLDGKTYKAFFDKVGLWVIDRPPGIYEASADQPALEGRSWTLSGRGVKSDRRGGYTLKVEGGKEPPVLDLVLR